MSEAYSNYPTGVSMTEIGVEFYPEETEEDEADDQE